MDGWDGLKAFQIKVPLYLNHLDERMTPIQMKRTHLCMEFLNAEALQQFKLQHMLIQVHAHTKILCILCYTVTRHLPYC